MSITIMVLLDEFNDGSFIPGRIKYNKKEYIYKENDYKEVISNDSLMKALDFTSLRDEVEILDMEYIVKYKDDKKIFLNKIAHRYGLEVIDKEESVDTGRGEDIL